MYHEEEGKGKGAEFRDGEERGVSEQQVDLYIQMGISSKICINWKLLVQRRGISPIKELNRSWPRTSAFPARPCIATIFC